MPLNQAIWTVGEAPQKIATSRLESERLLEDMIVAEPALLDSNWMLIGRQIQTDFKGIVDLLALQPDGSPVVIELKRDKTPRDVVGQLLDYASWVESLGVHKLQSIYEAFRPGRNLKEDFESRFGYPWDDDNLETNHQMVLVASELDSGSERIVQFLADKGVNVNVLFFQVFEHSGQQFLSRSWFVDPRTIQTSVDRDVDRGSWNGEFYVSFGADENRSWEDARRFGFVTASGGPWYTRTLGMLEQGDRVWVSIPREGYVGVGTVTGPAERFEEFTVRQGDKDIAISDLETDGNYAVDGTEEDCAWFVPVTWLHTVPRSKAVREAGFFGNQNTVAKPKSDKWEHTVQSLKKHWGIK